MQTEIIKYISIAALFIAVIMYIGFRQESHVYPCSLAEISPDIPVDVKQQCRKLLRKTPYMENNCVVQESQGKLIKTCG